MNSELVKTKSRVIFSQVARGFVQGFADNTYGPILLGHEILAYELDDDSLIFGSAKVREYDSDTGVLYLEVDHKALEVRPLSTEFTQSQDPIADQLDHEVCELVA